MKKRSNGKFQLISYDEGGSNTTRHQEQVLSLSQGDKGSQIERLLDEKLPFQTGLEQTRKTRKFKNRLKLYLRDRTRRAHRGGGERWGRKRGKEE